MHREVIEFMHYERNNEKIFYLSAAFLQSLLSRPFLQRKLITKVNYKNIGYPANVLYLLASSMHTVATSPTPPYD